MKKSVLIPATILLLLTIQAHSQEPQTPGDSALRHRVDSVVQAAIAADLIPGAVVQIECKGRIIYAQAYGLSTKYDFHHQPIPNPPAMDRATLFDLASLTKVVGTTTSLMVLVDRNRISVDDPVSKYLPGFDTGAKRLITIRHLLTHTAGLYEWYPLFYKSSHHASTIKLIESLPLHFPVGKQRKYSDLGFMLLGAIIEKVSGTSLDLFEYTNVFAPLNMYTTIYNPVQLGFKGNIAATSLGNPYEYRMTHDSSLGFLIPGLDSRSWNGWRKYLVRGEVNDGNAWYANKGIAGHAGLFSTVSNLQRLINMFFNRGMVGTRRFLSEQTIQTFLTPDAFHNGLGWMMDPDNSFLKHAPAGSFGHTGFTGTSIAVVPEYNLSVIILINRQNVGLQPNGTYYNPNPIRQTIFQAAMDWCTGNSTH